MQDRAISFTDQLDSLCFLSFLLQDPRLLSPQLFLIITLITTTNPKNTVYVICPRVFGPNEKPIIYTISWNF